MHTGHTQPAAGISSPVLVPPTLWVLAVCSAAGHGLVAPPQGAGIRDTRGVLSTPSAINVTCVGIRSLQNCIHVKIISAPQSALLLFSFTSKITVKQSMQMLVYKQDTLF